MNLASQRLQSNEVASGRKVTETDDFRFELRETTDGTLVITLCGRWSLGVGFRKATEVGAFLEAKPNIGRIAYDALHLVGWDTSLVAFLLKIQALAGDRNLSVEIDGLPKAVRNARARALSRREPLGRNARAAQQHHAPVRCSVPKRRSV